MTEQVPTCHTALSRLPLRLFPGQVQVVRDFFQNQEMPNEEEFTV